MSGMFLDPRDNRVVGRITKLLSDTMANENAVRSAAERELRELESMVDRQQGLVRVLLSISCCEQLGDVVITAAVYLKNVVKHCWNGEEAEHVLQEADKEYMRSSIFSAVLSSSGKIQATVLETISLICQIDFPEKWPNVVTVLAEHMEKGNSCSSMTAALWCGHSIFERYRKAPELTEKLKSELLVINATITHPMLEAMFALCEVAVQNPQECKLAIRGMTAACEMLFDLTFLDIGDEHEREMQHLMTFLLNCFQIQPADEKSVAGTEFQTGLLQTLQSSALACVTLHLQQYDEEFEPYVQQFTATVWEVLRSPFNRYPAADQLIMEAMNFVGTVARTEHYAMLQDALQTICETIIIPNLHLNDADVEMFQDEPFQYIQREIEGSDTLTRRRSACDLARSLMVRFESQVKGLLQQSANALLACGDWRARDAAFFLVAAISVKGGATNIQRTLVLNDIFPIGDFFAAEVAPELQRHTQGHPILSADAIHFVSTFREFIPATQYLQMLQELAVWLENSQVVLHTYAAHAIEKLLLVSDNGVPRLPLESHADLVPVILGNLCRRLGTDRDPNEYVMHALMRIMQVYPACTKPFVGHIVPVVGAALSENSKNPSNPKFNHYMFEVLSYCIKYCPEHGPAIESILWPSLMFILSEDVGAFFPYALQIIAQLLDARPSGEEVPSSYLQLYAPLVAPALFSQPGNIPAIARLLCAFSVKCPAKIVEMGLAEKTLGVFQYLISLKRHDHEGFNLIVTMMLHYPREVMDGHMATIVRLVLTQHQARNSAKYSRCCAVFFSVVVTLRGAEFLSGVLEGMQVGLTEMVLTKVWLPGTLKVVGQIERKGCAIGLTLLVSSHVSCVLSNPDLFVNCVFTILKVIHGVAEKDEDEAKFGAAKHLEEPSGDVNVYCPLRGAALPQPDPCPDVGNPQAFFTEHLAPVLASNPSLRSQLAKLPPEMVRLLPR